MKHFSVFCISLDDGLADLFCLRRCIFCCGLKYLYYNVQFSGSIIIIIVIICLFYLDQNRANCL